MKTFLPAVALIAALAATSAQAEGGVEVGVLTCTMEGVTNAIVYTREEFACIFQPKEGEPQAYVAILKEVGVNLSVTKENTLVWGVLAPTGDKFSPDVLRGTYVGGTGAVELGAGMSANVLIGGGNSITLQPISVSGMVGAGVALEFGALEIR